MNFVTYSKNEKAHDNVNYFLLEVSKNFVAKVTEIKEIKAKIDNVLELEIELNIDYKDLPFYCFKDENVSSIEELNFNELQKCSTTSDNKDDKETSTISNKYMLIFLGDFIGIKKSHRTFNKSFSEYHTKNPTVLFELEAKSGSEKSVIEGKILKAFHKQYQPEIKKT